MTGLRKLLAAGKIQDVIDELSKLTESNKDLNSELIVLSSAFKKHEKEYTLNTVSRGDLSIESNRITASLLTIIHRFYEDTTIDFISERKKLNDEIAYQKEETKQLNDRINSLMVRQRPEVRYIQDDTLINQQKEEINNLSTQVTKWSNETINWSNYHNAEIAKRDASYDDLKATLEITLLALGATCILGILSLFFWTKFFICLIIPAISVFLINIGIRFYKAFDGW